MTTPITYYKTAARPAARLWLQDDDGSLVDLSSGYTFVLKIGNVGQTALLTKSSGIAGAAGSGVEPTGTPNVTITWSAGELGIAAGQYTWGLTATSGGLPRVWSGPFHILDVIT